MGFRFAVSRADRVNTKPMTRRRGRSERSARVVLFGVALRSILLLSGAPTARAQQGQPVTRKKSLKYDPVGRVKEQLTQLLDADGKQVSAVRESYEYDPVGNRKALTAEELDAGNTVQRSY